MLCFTLSVLPTYRMLLLLGSSAAATAPPAIARAVQHAFCRPASTVVSRSKCYEDDEHAIRNHLIPRAVWLCLHTLRAAGHEVFLVGGAVRDMLLHLEPKDYDLLTSAHLKQVKALYPASHLIGRNFPICVVNSQGARVEVSSMHTLSAATTGNSKTTQNAAVPADVAAHLLGTMHEQQGRHIVQLPHGAPSWAAAKRANALSRDFTVNGLLYDPFQRVLYDYIDGVADINSRQLRCIGDPGIRFQKDPACLLRAVRCAARAGLSIEPSTACALQQHSHLVTSLNAQRLTAELIALLGHGAAAASLAMLQKMQLLQRLLPLHIELCKQGKQRVEQAWQQQQCHWQCQTQTINQQQQQHLQNSTIAAPTFHNYSVTSGHSSVSSSSYEHQNKVEFDIVMPRTNKQYRKWLQQQRTPEVQAGSISSNGSMQDLFLAAVAATSEEGDSIGNKWKTAQGAGRQWQQQWQPVAMQLSKQQYAVHQVLSSAGAGLHDLHQTLTRLQRALPS
eukprot:GHRR01026977.1.p1 GENE.GHRR01026977.1~~GHRR01026977.1.p1  ORF type:complete len:505 (+),score=176.79 GHRR01026977.1:222-1736(+)